MPQSSQTTNPNIWIGSPRTAQNIVPLTAGLLFGQANSAQGGTPALGRTRLLGAQLTNAAAASPVGFAVLMPDSAVAIGTWAATGYQYTDTTGTAQGSGTDLITVVPTVTNNGFVVGCVVPHNVIGIDLSTASYFNAALTLDYAYWGYPTNGRTSSAATWVTVSTNLLALDTTTAISVTGEHVAVLNVVPNLMVKTVAGDFTGGPGGYYWLRVRKTSTEPSTQIAQSSHVYAGVELARHSSLAQNAQLNLAAGTGGNSRITPGVGLQGFFGTTNAGNHVYFEFE